MFCDQTTTPNKSMHKSRRFCTPSGTPAPRRSTDWEFLTSSPPPPSSSSNSNTFASTIPILVSGGGNEKPSIQDRLSKLRRRRQQQESSLSNLLGISRPIPQLSRKIPKQVKKKEHFFENTGKHVDGNSVTEDGGDDEDDEDMTVQEEGRPQEEEERMVEETRERMGKTLLNWLPKNDTLANLMPVDMLADQIVGNVNIAQEELARKRGAGKHSPLIPSLENSTTTITSKQQQQPQQSCPNNQNKRSATTDLFASFLDHRSGNAGSSSASAKKQYQQQQQNKLSKERLIEIEEEQETVYFMSVWIEHHVEPVLKHHQQQQKTSQLFSAKEEEEEEEAEQSESACDAILESRSSSCSYILPFPKAPGLLALMRGMIISTAQHYDPNPFSVKPKPGTSSDLIVSPM